MKIDENLLKKLEKYTSKNSKNNNRDELSFQEIQFKSSERVSLNNFSEKDFYSKFKNNSLQEENSDTKHFDDELPEINPHKFSSTLSKISNENIPNSNYLIQNSDKLNSEPQTSTDNTDPNSNNQYLIKSFYPNESIEFDIDIDCSYHESKKVKFWNEDNKLLLCDQCIQELKKQNKGLEYTHLENSIPSIYQNISKTIQNINFQNNILKCRKSQLKYQKDNLMHPTVSVLDDQTNQH